MTEQEIFLAAIDIADPAARSAFIERACAGNAPLRQQIEALLAAHDGAGDFLATPAAKQLSGESPTQHGVQPGADSESDDGFQTVQLKSDTTTIGLERFFTAPTQPKSLGRLGHYEVYEVLGRGAFGTVLKAFDDKLHRMVAIKVMSPELAVTSPPRKRFLREARSSAAIRHDNVVAVHAVEEQPIPYLVMEYIPGQTLQQALEQNGPLDVADILRIGQQIAGGLAAAHAQSLIHRDIKPANILMENGLAGRVKITDFGLARAADDASLTQSGTIAGTPMFMSPEQATTGTLDHRSDLFSLGSVMYLMASGRPPFRAANTMAVLKRVVEETPRPISEIIANTPAWLCAIISKLHAKQPEDRFATAQEVADLLGKCLADLQGNRPVVLPAGMSGQWTGDGGQPEKSPSKPAVGDGGTASQLVPAMLSPGFASSSPLAPALPLTNTAERVRERGEQRTRSQRWPTIAAAALLVTAGVVGWVILSPKSPTPKPSDVAQTGDTRPSDTRLSAIEPPPAGWHGWPADAPQPAIAPFDAAQAKKHQEAWASYLNVPVEYTNSIGMKFCLIPPGEFLMGSTEEEIEEELKVTGGDRLWQDCIKSESPQHRVILTQPVYLGVNEVTQAEYEQVMGTNPSHFSPSGLGKEAIIGIDTANHPVDSVSWNDAAEFCSKLSQQDKLRPHYSRTGQAITLLNGTGYRLPGEATWEFACRAGTTTKYWTGDQVVDLARSGWFDKNSGDRTHAVGELKANPFGLFDIHGNVWEWVADGWELSFYSQFQEKPAIDPIAQSTSGLQCALRGGDWLAIPSTSRSPSRSFYGPSSRPSTVGFRTSLPVDAVRQAMKSTGPALPNAGPKNPLAFTQPGFDDWVNSVAALPAEEQVEVVQKKLEELNPGCDGKLQHSIEEGVVTVVDVKIDHMTDLSPLRAFVKLQGLSLMPSDPKQARLTDLSPLKGLPLIDLQCIQVPVSDLTPLRGMKLMYLFLMATKVTDLEPLAGMPLGLLRLDGSPVADLSPLKGLPLGRLWIQKTNVKDVSLLKTLPLIDVNLDYQPERDEKWLRDMKGLETINEKPAAELWQDVEGKKPLAFTQPRFDDWVASVAKLPAEEQVAAVSKKLVELNPGFDGNVAPKIEEGVVTEFWLSADVSDISPVRALPGLPTLTCDGRRLDKAKFADLSPLRGLPLTVLELFSTQVSDLSPLKGMPLKVLWIPSTQVEDLSPLKYAPLTKLNIQSTPVVDLSPLQGMKLTHLFCSNTRIADLSPLKGLPLQHLQIEGTQVVDLSPLKGIPLEHLAISNLSVTDLTPLQGMPLKSLDVGSTQVADLSVLKGLPLKILELQKTLVTDLSPLKDMPLIEIRLDFKPERDTELLRSIKTLEKINQKPAAEFWKDVDQK